MDNHRITKVLFEFKVVEEESEEGAPTAEQQKATRQAVNWSTEEIRKDGKAPPER
jgi:hypothetical protein